MASGPILSNHARLPVFDLLCWIHSWCSHNALTNVLADKDPANREKRALNLSSISGEKLARLFAAALKAELVFTAMSIKCFDCSMLLILQAVVFTRDAI
jgi:hypothetical protein